MIVSQELHEIGKGVELGLGVLHSKYEETEAQTSKPLYKVCSKTVTNLGLVSLFLVQSYFHQGLVTTEPQISDLMSYLAS